MSNDTLRIRVAGSLDAYYADQSGEDKIIPFSTTPFTAQEFSIALARAGIIATGREIKVVLIGQLGTVADANYVGPDAQMKFLGEAWAGIYPVSEVEIDVGLFSSHLGVESIVPSENLLFTRSLAADNSPYYLTGIRGTWTINPFIRVSSLLVNGWQLIVDNNPQKSIGTQITYTPSADVTVNWSTLSGTEADVYGNHGTRYFSNLYADLRITNGVRAQSTFDCGVQNDSAGKSRWFWTVNGLVSVQPTSWLRAVGRLEYYSDKHGVVVATPGERRFQVVAATCGIHATVDRHADIGLEVRGYSASEPVYLRSDGSVHSIHGIVTLAVGVRL